MDWSLHLCISYDSFYRKTPRMARGNALQWYRATHQEPFNIMWSPSNFIPLVGNFWQGSSYAQVSLRTTFEKMMEEIDTPAGRKIAKQLSLQTNVGPSIFSDFAGVQIASVDAISKITGSEFGIANPQSFRQFNYLVMQDNSSSVVQYLQYRYPLSLGAAIPLQTKPNPHPKTLSHTEISAYEKLIGSTTEETPFVKKWLTGVSQRKNVHLMYRQLFEEFDNSWTGPIKSIIQASWKRLAFTSLYGKENFSIPVTGNIIQQWRGLWPGQNVDSPLDNVQRYDFFCAEYDLRDTNERNYQSLFLTFLCIGLRSLLKGANMAVKCFIPLTLVTAEIIYLVSQCFEEITLVPPCETIPSFGCYLLGKNFYDDERCGKIIAILTDLHTVILNRVYLDPNYDLVAPDNNVFLKSIFARDYVSIWPITAPTGEAFTVWMENMCDQLLIQQINNCRNVQNVMFQGQVDHSYYYPKFLTVCHLPDTPRTDTVTSSK